MSEISENDKSKLREKLREFQKKGLELYGKYLDEQLDYASNSESRSAYKSYVEEQIKLNEEKIKEMGV